jgi:DNA polymerase IV
VERRLVELGIAGRTLTLKVRWSTFELVTRAISRPQGYQVSEEILPVLRELLSGLVDGKRAVRLLGVIVSGLVSPEEMQRARQIVTPSLWQEEQVQARSDSPRHTHTGHRWQ